MPRTLYAKLAAVLLALFAVLGASYLALTVFTTSRHIQEVNQHLNQGLAGHLVSEKILMEDGRINEAVLKDVFHMLMVINPNIELYLLDLEGRILAFSAPPGAVEREAVSLEPVRAFLAGEHSLPILGDDPRDATRRKIFSVARVGDGGADSPGGYLYIVLASEEYDSAAEMLGQSYVLRLSLAIAAGGLLFALAGGLLGFGVLTRRLRSLAASMDEFRRRHRGLDPGGDRESGPGVGDEIDQLSAAFEQMAARIDEQMRRLEDKDALRRELVANVSHDLRTPVAALHGYLETLALKEEHLQPAERAEYLGAALRHSERLGRLINELFELAKLDAGETRPHLEAFSMGELVQDVVQEYQLRAEENGVRLEAQLGQTLPFVEADIGMIERVLGNLIDNALRHTPRDGTVTVRLALTGELLRVEVQDTGCGIAAEELPRIFDRFYRAASNGATGGMGLGLAISKRILELHGRSIEARSASGEGTTFCFTLPVVAGPPAS